MDSGFENRVQNSVFWITDLKSVSGIWFFGFRILKLDELFEFLDTETKRRCRRNKILNRKFTFGNIFNHKLKPMKKTLLSLIAFISLTLIFCCNQNTGGKNTNNTEVENENSADNPSSKNPLLGKSYYVASSIEKGFETFSENSEQFTIFYFKDNSTVIYFANINGWQKGITGRYKYENDELVMNIPYYFTGSQNDENFGGDVKIVNDKQIIVLVDGNPRYKFLNFIPPK